MKLQFDSFSLFSREDYANVLKTMTAPLRPYYSPMGARLRVLGSGAVYPRVSQEHEGAMRVLWGLFSLWAGDPDETFFRDVYRRAFLAGTDPASPEYWGEDMRDYDQRFVEYATLSAGMILCPDIIMADMDEAARGRFADFCFEINRHTIPDNNWRFFRVLMNVALRRLGFAWDKDRLREDMELIEGCYLGDGWYSDGLNGISRDYYVAFGMHYYGLLYSVAAADADPEGAARFRLRATLFARDFLCYFDPDGASVAYGRSQTYRFAQIAFFSALVFAGVDALPFGVVKGVINRNLRYFLSMPLWDNGGVLTVGYGYPNLTMSEQYNAAGSPYWAYKAFLLLALPADHPYFSAPELPLPAQPSLHALPHARLLSQRTRTDTLLLGGGQGNGPGLAKSAEKYAKFAYSAHFAFSVSRGDRDLVLAAPDSMLCFCIGGHYFSRTVCESFSVTDDKAVSVWSPFPGVRVTTEIIPSEDGHLRRHTVESSIACCAYDCGFAAPLSEERNDLSVSLTQTAATLRTDAATCLAECRGMAGKPGYITPVPNTNLVAQRTVIPYVCYEIPVGESRFETYCMGEWHAR